MPRLVSLREICFLFNGTDLELMRLSKQGRPGGANYRLQLRHAARDLPPLPACVDVWGEYETMAELCACPVFRWALELAGETLADEDPRQEALRVLLTR